VLSATKIDLARPSAFVVPVLPSFQLAAPLDSGTVVYMTSVSPITAPPTPLSFDDFSLSLISFDGQGRLSSLTKAAAGVLGVEWEEGKLPELSAEEFLGLKSEDEAPIAARERLRELARRSRELRWGESVALEYYTRDSTGGRKKERAEVLVASSSSSSSSSSAGEGDDTGYSILFLRPASSDSSSTPSPSHPTTAVAKSSSPPIPPPLPPSTLSSSSIDTTSSVASTSTSSRKPGRPAVGDVRSQVTITPVLHETFAHLTTPLWSQVAAPPSSTSPPTPSSASTTVPDARRAAYHLLPEQPHKGETPSLEVLFDCLDMLPTISFISSPDSQILHVNKACVPFLLSAHSPGTDVLCFDSWHKLCGTDEIGRVSEEVYLYHHHPEDLAEAFRIYQSSIAAKTSYTVRSPSFPSLPLHLLALSLLSSTPARPSISTQRPIVYLPVSAIYYAPPLTPVPVDRSTIDSERRTGPGDGRSCKESRI
jgi:hypothetical protein